MNTIPNPIDIFDQNIQSVSRLINFDRDVLDMVIGNIEQLHKKLVDEVNLQNELHNGKRLLDVLRGIRTNDSLRPRYQLIFNQAVVLLVSHFGSALSDLFRYAVEVAIETGDKRVLSEELTLDIDELLSSGDHLHEVLGDMLILKKDISFQDMKSVSRAFKKYFGIEIGKDACVNDIILGQACRHAIVHDGGRTNSRTLRQTTSAKPRNLKADLGENQKIEFTPDEVELLGNYMRTYASNLLTQIELYKTRVTRNP